MKVSWGYCTQHMESHKIHVPNHQPVMGLSFRAMGEIPMIMRYCDDLLYQLRLPDCQIARLPVLYLVIAIIYRCISTCSQELTNRRAHTQVVEEKTECPFKYL